MPHVLAFMALGATLGFAKKLVARYLHGTEITQIHEDPPDVRTVARVELAEGSHLEVLAALAAALEPAIGACTVTDDAVVARSPGGSHDVDVVRVRPRGPRAFTLELTRAWTGPRVEDADRELLAVIHEAVATHPSVRDVRWHWRQDRQLVVVHALPVASS